jgi:capsular exopolysaccharide synthesis family protein
MAGVLEGSHRSADFAGSPSPPDPSREEPLELRRYWGGIRRNWLLMAFIIVPITTVALVLSLTLPKTYRATARIVLEDVPGFQTDTVETLQRRLATLRTIITTREVLAAAAERVPGEDADTLADKVTASVDAEANVINISAVDGSARGASTIANAVATAFLEKRRGGERQRVARTRAALLQALNRVRASGTPTARAEEQAIQERLSELSVTEVSIGSDLQLAQLARPPENAASPKPIRNTVFAFFASAVLATLVALAYAQFTPRISGPRELGRLLRLPVLAGVPRRRSRRMSQRVAEQDAYRSLQASIRMRLGDTRQNIILVTSAVPGEGKTEVSAELGRQLAHAGYRTLLVSADLRRPTLHRLLDVSSEPGLTDVLRARARHNDRPSTADVIAPVRVTPFDNSGRLAVLPSGGMVEDPSGLLAGDGIDRVFDEIERIDFQYVIVDGPPLLATVDAQALALRLRNLLLVVRLDRVTPENVLDARELLNGLNTLGVVVVGSPTATYY